MMRLYFFILFSVFVNYFSFGQDSLQLETIKGIVLNAADDKPISDVNIINLNQVTGTTTNKNGEFQIQATINDTIYLSYLGFKSINVRITQDWKKYGDVKIKMTEVGFALEEVVVSPLRLTGFLEIDAKNIPIYDNTQYQIAGTGKSYEAGSSQPSGFSKTLSAVFSPFDFLHNTFGNKGRQMRKLRKMKEDDEIQRLLSDKFDRETLSVLLQVSKDDITKILEHCNYSKSFIKTANDLQILDGISHCYENYRAVNKK